MGESLKIDIFEIMEDIYQQIEAQLDKPFAFYGHSMGTILAYLLVHKIKAERKLFPLHLFVSGRGGPAIKEERQRHLLLQDEFRIELEEMGGIPKEVLEDEGLMGFYEPILRADFKALETYHYSLSSSSELVIPITVMIGKEDDVSFEEAIEWQKETIVPLEIYQFEGGHFFIFDHAKAVADLISETLVLNTV